MTFKELYQSLEKNGLYVFSAGDVRSFYRNESGANLKRSILRWKNRGWLYTLKRGLYELTYPKDFTIPDMYIANKLYSPSYISLETALSYYSIIPEVSMAVTSITTKSTRRFKNKHGLFIYHAIQTKAFTGYYVEKNGSFNILIAEPEKALIDYLYFRAHRNKQFNPAEERLDRGIIARLNRKKLKKYASLYNINQKELYAYL
ncbi:MAG: hypothetical protein V1709_09180 [Planctomycetota bacterium]